MPLGHEKKRGTSRTSFGAFSRGLSTKSHAGCIDEKTGVSIVLTGGERNDMPGFALVFAQLPAENHLAEAGMDKGYDSNHIREQLQEEGIHPVIPPKSKRTAVIDYDKDKDKLREKVESFFNKLKQ